MDKLPPHLVCPSCGVQLASSMKELTSYDLRKSFVVCDGCDRHTCIMANCLQPNPHLIRPPLKIRCKDCFAVSNLCNVCFGRSTLSQELEGSQDLYMIDACFSCARAAAAKKARE